MGVGEGIGLVVTVGVGVGDGVGLGDSLGTSLGVTVVGGGLGDSVSSGVGLGVGEGVSLSSGVFAFSKTIFLLAIMTAFILIELRLTKRKIHYAFKNNREKIQRISNQTINQTVRYISIKFFISLATGVLCFLCTWLTGLDFPLVWAFLSFIMNFIPIFGSIISVGLTTLFSIIQFYPHWGKPVFILIFMTTVNMLVGNILEPRIEGKNLGISPFAILISLSIWGYIWGFTGMLLAIPLTVIIKIICENLEYTKSFAIIIGNDPRQGSNQNSVK